MPHMSQTSASTLHGHLSQAPNSKPVKMKRTRQRVDAGEPRNSYASIANFSSRGGYHGYSGHKYGSTQSLTGNSTAGSGSAGLLHHNQHSSTSAQHQSSGSLVAASMPGSGSGQNNQAVQGQGQSAESSLFTNGKQLPDPASAFNAAAMAAAAASRPEMLMDPTFLQMCHNQMAALINTACSTPPQAANKSNLKFSPEAPPASAADQFAFPNPFYNANSFLSQLQATPDNLAMMNFMNNLNSTEPSAINPLFNPSAIDAQLLRDILEGGRNDKSPLAFQQLQKLSHLANEKFKQSRYSGEEAELGDVEFALDTDHADANGGKDITKNELATPGEEAENESGSATGCSEEEASGGELTIKTIGCGIECAQGYGCDETEEDERAEPAKETDSEAPSGSGSALRDKEVVKTSGAREAAQEERRARVRPPQHALPQRSRAKSTAGPGDNASSPSVTAAGALEATSLGDASSSLPFEAKISSREDPNETHSSEPSSDQVSGRDDDDDDDDDDDHSDSASGDECSVSSKRARVENIVSSMLLVTTSNAASACVSPATASSPSSARLSPAKSYSKSEDESDPTSLMSKPSSVNGCKKRKLYQPQQSSKMQPINGSMDTEDDIDEETGQESGEAVGVEAELDEGYEDIERSSPKQTESSKELDLSSVSVAHQRNQRSEHLPTKRARFADYDREYNVKHLQQLQSQLLHKYTLQMLNQQQQQSKTINGSSHYARASPVNLITPNDCDNAESEEPAAEVSKEPKSRLTNGGHSVRIYDVDYLVESVTGQIVSSVSRIIEHAIRTQLEAQARLGAESGKEKSKSANELLSQMLDVKYSRNKSTGSVASPNNSVKAAGRGASPFVLPSEASPAPKPFAYPQGSLTSNLYGKQSGFYSSSGFASSYSNLNARETNAMLLNSLRDSNSSNSPASNLGYGRDEASPGLPEQTEAISLVVAPKKRRNKVTDSRLTPRTVTRLPREDGRESSPPIGNGPIHFASPALPVSLASLQQATEFFDPITSNATAFPFAEHASRLSGFFNGDESDFKNGLTNGVNGSSANPSVVSAVAQAAAAHHLQMLAASRASPDSLNGFQSSLLGPYGRGSGTGSENGGDGSETNDTQSAYDPGMPMTSTLSPMHLRKAKLMFFYVRYPSSSILKMFFPDIKFNKNNTAQLVKWFSNFREFYYIQMEKYARQAISEGIKGVDDLQVTDDCELLRVLNLHYNRSNHIPIPENFRTVSETTLREFFRALQQNKDTEQSWKKSIYKIIARLDDSVPEYFKNPNFMEQLE